MEIRKYIDVSSQKAFVDGVIKTSSIDGVYSPALMQYAIRVNAILFFSDYKFELDEEGYIEQDKANEVAFGTDIYHEILEQSPQLLFLIEACKEQAKINNQLLMLALQPADPLTDFFEFLKNLLEGIAPSIEGFNMETIKQIGAAMGAFDNEKIAGLAKEVGSKASPKKPKQTKAKTSPKDKIIQIPGQISIDEVTDTGGV